MGKSTNGAPSDSHLAFLKFGMHPAANTVARGHIPLPSSYSYVFDATGNFTTRPGGWTLSWDHENRLGSISSSSLSESYLYDAAPSGFPQQIKKTSNGVSSYYTNPLLSESVVVFIMPNATIDDTLLYSSRSLLLGASREWRDA